MEFEQVLEKYRHIVNNQLNIFFDNKIRNTSNIFLKESYNYLKEFVLRPGKRIRPIATIMAYKSIKDSNEEEIYPVCIVPELFHSSSLIHDDIMDEDLLRRNEPTMHRIFEEYFKRNFEDKEYNGYFFKSFSKRFGISMAIIQGNILYSLSYLAILESKFDENTKNKTLEIFNQAYCRTNEGQIFDLLLTSKQLLNEKDYIDMAVGKTSFPLSAAIKFGAMINHAKPSQLKIIERYAQAIGLAFQIHDDMMDINKKMKKGRELGSDIRRGNKTLMIIKSLQKSNEKQKKFLLYVLGNDKANEAELEKAIKIIKLTNGLDYATNYAKNKINEAKKFLKKANINKEGCKFFREFADYVVDRKV